MSGYIENRVLISLYLILGRFLSFLLLKCRKMAKQTFEVSEVAVDSGFLRYSIALRVSTGCGRSSDHCRGAAGSCGDSLVGLLSPHLNPGDSGLLQRLP